MAELEQISQILNGTLSPDNSTRRTAEEQLIEFSKNCGLAEFLLQLIGNKNISEQIRMAASLALKNFSGDGEAPLDIEERSRIREAVLQLLFDVPIIFRRQLSQVACHIGKHDFPDKWPRLIEVICECVTVSNNFDRLNAALSTLDELVKRYRYEMRSNKLFLEILTVMKAIGEPLTQLYSKLLQYFPSENEPNSMSLAEKQTLFDLLYLIVKCYYSLISQDLPEHFEDNLTPWMSGFLQLIKTNVSIVDNSRYESEPSIIEKIKGSICQIITLYSQRYEECFQPFAESFVRSVWELMIGIDLHVRYDSLINSGLGFLSAICQRQQYVKFFKGEGVLKMICENIIVKNLMLREEDSEMYECEPFDFLKRDIEGSDLETRRRGACEFVKALCKFFEAEIFDVLSTAVIFNLSAYERDPQSHFIRKDVVYCLVSALATKTTTVKYGATSTSQLIDVSDFYERQVRLDLLEGDVNSLPILKGDALKYLVLFRNQLKPEYLVEALSGINNQIQNSIIRLLSSSHILLHHYTAYAFERLLLVKTPTGQPVFNSTNVPVGCVIESLFNCLRDPLAYNTHYIMKALMRCFTIIDDTVAQNAHLYVNQLGQIIIRAIENPINPQLVHFIFECLCVLIRKAYTKVQGGLDGHVISIIELIIPRDIVDFVPYSLQITALLLDQSKTEREQGREVSQDQYLNFFPFLLKGDFWARLANVPALILVFESFIDCFPQIVLGTEYLSQVMGIYQRLIGSKAHDHNGFRLAAAMLPYIESNASQLTPRELILPLLNRMHSLKTPKFAKQFVLFFFRYAIVKGGVNLARALESIQAGIFLMVTEKIILVEMKNMPHMTSYEEKRIVSIGVASLISETINELGSFFAPLVEEAIAILEVFERKKGDGDGCIEEQYVESNDLEYSDPYCKLSYAQHIDSIGTEVKDVRKHLANAVLVCAYNANNNSINCLSANAQNTLRAYANAQ